MSDLKKYLNKQLKDKEFREEWEKLQPEMAIIRAMVKTRINKNITQKELSLKTGIDQADISKIENGTRIPSLKILQRIANAMDLIIQVEFKPKRTSLAK